MFLLRSALVATASAVMLCAGVGVAIPAQATPAIGVGVHSTAPTNKEQAPIPRADTRAQPGALAIGSVQCQGQYIADSNASPGKPITMTTNTGNTWSVDPPVDAAPVTIVTIFDENTGLYMGVDQAVPGATLTYQTNEFQWQVARLSSGEYVIFPVSVDLFVVPSYCGESAPLKLKPGSNIVGNEAFWTFNPVA